MIKALFTFDYYEENIKKIEELGYEITYIKEENAYYNENIKDTEVLICYNPFSTLDISKLKKLKWIQVSSIGIDHVPKDIALSSGITVTNNKGGYKIPIGEWIVMNILNLLKNVSFFYNNQQQSRWRLNTKLLELYGKTVGFIGTGTIAMEAAKRLKGFEVNILGVNTSGRQVQYFDCCYSMEHINKVLADSDIVVLALPYTKETHQLIDENMFSYMKDNVFFINIARGTIVDEKALIKNLQSGKIAGAALDVFEEEPLPKSSPLRHMDNVMITPHNSWASEAGNERRTELIHENLKRYAHNQSLVNITDITKGY